MITLTVETRDASVNVPHLRESGSMPAVVYGPKQEAISISLSLKEFETALKEAGESSVITLSGLSKPISALIYDVDYEPVKGMPRHADFYAIEAGAKVEVAVPLVFTGESPAIKAGANLVKVLRELDIEADAAHLPHNINVDLAVLVDTDTQIHASDITLPKGVVLITEPDEVVVLAQEVSVEEEVPTEGPDLSSIEVEKKGKQEEGGEEKAG